MAKKQPTKQPRKKTTGVTPERSKVDTYSTGDKGSRKLGPYAGAAPQ